MPGFPIFIWEHIDSDHAVFGVLSCDRRGWRSCCWGPHKSRGHLHGAVSDLLFEGTYRRLSLPFAIFWWLEK